MSLTTCCNVKVAYFDLKIAEAFFAAPRPKLDKLVLEDRENMATNEDISRIAKNSGRLRDIYIRGLHLSREALQYLSGTNKDIEEVTVELS